MREQKVIRKGMRTSLERERERVLERERKELNPKRVEM